ncbi:fluoride efflux transporter CrcB [Rhodococcus chondri]|uniref:Fluoride-specific ion channel FluC n=1 Tax=Rhodococcus chondri TaxID=3065941 RepID=A0ABU7JPQ2_9NOCA|nr:fluoride efflux transporter CrcB [Rhodococcus sp. CC-R104]MEE2032011.1 fluoride efflux transporter CrcB [Rhodococcus sp. CC-R104]
MTALWVSLAGSLGAVARFVLDGEIRRRVRSNFPWGTLAVNVSGSFLLGLLVGVVVFHDADPGLEIVLGAGFCGGYTTFSAVSVEAVQLIRQRRRREAIFDLAGTLALALAGCALGLGLAAWSG